MKIQLFTKEEIEKCGFIYEADISKCKTCKTKIHYNGSSIDKKGNVINSPSVIDTGCMTEKQLKEEVVFGIPYKYVNSIFVIFPDTIPYFGHSHNKVMVSGHTRKPDPTDEEVEKFTNRNKGNPL
jgi:hypothetical protein